jgi:hypothetical protein
VGRHERDDCVRQAAPIGARAVERRVRLREPLGARGRIRDARTGGGAMPPTSRR